jgi:hypothetical protein
MNGRPPGPVCSSRLGFNWIDEGTNCLFRSASPGSLGFASSAFVSSGVFGPIAAYPWMVKYNVDHIYSTAPEAATKRRIDLQIIGGDYKRGSEVSLDNEPYLKKLVEIASAGKYVVGVSSAFQFFIIRGGAEGFLPASMLGQDASNVELAGATTDGSSGLTFRFDNNDLLVVFDSAGALVSAARLERPLFITGIWSQKTANKVYDAWADKEVFIYKNTSFDIPYLGLGVKDGFRGKKATVDMHKQEATNGCIFIVDPSTPAIDDSNLGSFEPKLIQDVLARAGTSLASIGRKQVPLGVMRVIDIK